MAHTKRIVVATLWLLALITLGNIVAVFWELPNIGLAAGVLVGTAIATGVPNRVMVAMGHAGSPAATPAVSDPTIAG